MSHRPRKRFGQKCWPECFFHSLCRIRVVRVKAVDDFGNTESTAATVRPVIDQSQLSKRCPECLLLGCKAEPVVPAFMFGVQQCRRAQIPRVHRKLSPIIQRRKLAISFFDHQPKLVAIKNLFPARILGPNAWKYIVPTHFKGFASEYRKSASALPMTRHALVSVPLL